MTGRFGNNVSGKRSTSFFVKFLREMVPSVKRAASKSIWGVAGTFISIGIICHLTFIEDVHVLIAPFGASAVLLYDMPKSAFAQPRNVLGGHIIAAVIGVGIYHLFGIDWFTAAASVAAALAAMNATGTTHPPAGATALIAVTTGQNWSFVILPVGLGVVILLLTAVLFNNIAQKRSYPNYWW